MEPWAGIRVRSAAMQPLALPAWAPGSGGGLGCIHLCPLRPDKPSVLPVHVPADGSAASRNPAPYTRTDFPADSLSGLPLPLCYVRACVTGGGCLWGSAGELMTSCDIK